MVGVWGCIDGCLFGLWSQDAWDYGDEEFTDEVFVVDTGVHMMKVIVVDVDDDEEGSSSG